MLIYTWEITLNYSRKHSLKDTPWKFINRRFIKDAMDYGVKIFDISKDLKTQGFLDSMLSRQSSINLKSKLH